MKEIELNYKDWCKSIWASVFDQWMEESYQEYLKDKKNIIFFKKTKDENYFNLNKYIYFQLKKKKY